MHASDNAIKTMLRGEEKALKECQRRCKEIAARRCKEIAAWGGMVPFMRSKLMYVGEGRAGKTSLHEALLGIPCDPGQQAR